MLSKKRQKTRGSVRRCRSEKARKKVEEAVRRFEAGHREVLRRMAINYYVRQTRAGSTVDSSDWPRFVAASVWLQTCFDSLPPDEARRRLTFAYRLVFPPPEEIGAPKASAAKVSKARPSPTRKPGAPAKPKLQALEADETPESPF